MGKVNKNWRPYVYKEESTYPKKDKLVLVWTGVRYFVGTFNGRNFVEEGCQVVFNTPVFWQYVDKAPKKVDVIIDRHCLNVDNPHLCSFAGMGICKKVDSPETCPYYSKKRTFVGVNEEDC